MSRLVACLLIGLLAWSGVNRGQAFAAPNLDVQIERDVTPRLQVSDLFANFRVTITDAATKQPPAANYGVFALANNTRGEATMAFPCGQLADNDPGAPRGIYACTVVVDHGGAWNLVAVVNEKQIDNHRAPTEVARAQMPFEIATDTVYTGDAGKPRVAGRASDVAVLWTHTAAAAAWLVCLALLSLVALPATRRQLSSRALNRLESHFDLLLKSAGAATLATLGSGVYLLLKDTAYRTPFSPSAVDAVFALPYAKPYFLTLGAKLALYAAMGVAAGSLIRAGRRQLQLSAHVPAISPGAASSPNRSQDRSPWDSSERAAAQAPGRTILKTPAAVRVRTRADAGDEPAREPARSASTTGALIGAYIIVVGVVSISICITLLKYFHELIEAARGL